MSTLRSERSLLPGTRLPPAGAVTAAVPRSAGRAHPPEPAARSPRHEYPALGAVTTLAAVLCTWGIVHGVYHVFYASAVRSMTNGPAAFFYGSFDPSNSITLDKLPGFLWPQALSAMVFGFHPWALVLPQGIETVCCVPLLHLLVRRWAGASAGLLAAGLFALTPVVVGLGRSIAEDAPFALLLLLAAEAAQRAVVRARLRTLLAAAVWVGLAFQCKMLEAWAVLPSLGVTYLVGAPTHLRRRIGHLAVTGAATLVVSASWIAVASLTPAHDRPYMDGTTDNSPVSMVVGYNFLNRFTLTGIDAARTGAVVTGPSTAHAAAHAPRLGDSVLKMFSPGIASQTGWLYPLAATGLAWGLAAAWRRRAHRTDRALLGYVMWGMWLATFFAIFSLGSVTGHTYYMGVVAVALCALSGAGLVRCVRATRAGSRGAWVFPAVISVNVLWCALLTSRYSHFVPWQAPVVVALGALGLVLVLFGAFGPGKAHRVRTVAAGLVLGTAAVVVVPAVWSASALSPRYNQVGGLGRVGPSSKPGAGGPARLAGTQHRLLAYLEAHRHSAEYLFAVPRWNEASAYVIAADAPVLPMGGFTGQVPFPTPSQFRHLVATGALRYVLLSPGDMVRARRGTSPTGLVVRSVESGCAGVRVTRAALPVMERLYRCDPSDVGALPARSE